MTRHTLDTAGGRAVLIGAVLLLVLAVASGILGLKSNGGTEGLGGPAPARSCPRTVARPGPAIDLGVQPSRRGSASLSPAEVRRLVVSAKHAGAKVISTTATWRGIQPHQNGPLNWGGLDKVIDAARAEGLQVRVTAETMPAWAQTAGGRQPASTSKWRAPRTDRELAYWRDFIGLLVHHIDGRVKYLQVWTEPNLRKTWTSGPDPRAFVRLLHTTYDRAKSIDPQLQVVSGGLSGNDLGFLSGMYAAKKQMYGASARIFDLVGVDPWSSDRSPLEDSSSYVDEAGAFGEIDYNFLGFRRMHEQMVAEGDDKTDLYIGSFGYGIGNSDRGRLTDAQRAGYAREALNATVCYPYVAAFSWYYLSPTPWDPANWTLLDADLRPNRTYAAIRTWAEQPISREGKAERPNHANAS